MPPRRTPNPARSPMLHVPHRRHAVAPLLPALLLAVGVLATSSLLLYGARTSPQASSQAAAAIQPDDGAETYVHTATWTMPPLDTPLYSPSDLALDPAGNVYVADFGASEVRVFDPQGNLVDTWAQLTPPEVPADCWYRPVEILYDEPLGVPPSRPSSIYVSWEGVDANIRKSGVDPIACGMRIERRPVFGISTPVRSLSVVAPWSGPEGRSFAPLLFDPSTGELQPPGFCRALDRSECKAHENSQVDRFDHALMFARYQTFYFRHERAAMLPAGLHLIAHATGEMNPMPLPTGYRALAIAAVPSAGALYALAVDLNTPLESPLHAVLFEFATDGELVATHELPGTSHAPLARRPSNGWPTNWRWRLTVNSDGQWAYSYGSPDVRVLMGRLGREELVSLASGSISGLSGKPSSMMLPRRFHQDEWSRDVDWLEVAALPGNESLVLDRALGRVVRLNAAGHSVRAYPLPSAKWASPLPVGAERVELHYAGLSVPEETDVAFGALFRGWPTHHHGLSIFEGHQHARLDLVTGESSALGWLGQGNVDDPHLGYIREVHRHMVARGEDRFYPDAVRCIVKRMDAARTTTAVRIPCPLDPPRHWPDGMDLDADGNLITLDSLAGSVDVWNPDTAAKLRSFPVGQAGQPLAITAGRAASGALRLVVVTTAPALDIYDLLTGTLVDSVSLAPYASDDVLALRDLSFAMTDRGRILLVPPSHERDMHEVHVYEAGPRPAAPPPTPGPTPAPEACLLTGTKTVQPAVTTMGEAVRVELSAHMTCPGAPRPAGMDLVVAIDRLGEAERRFGNIYPVAHDVAAILAMLSPAADRVSLVVDAVPVLTQTARAADVLDALAALPPPPIESEAPSLAQTLAAAEASSVAAGRPAAVPIVLLMSLYPDHTMLTAPEAVVAAERLRDQGIGLLATAHAPRGSLDPPDVLRLLTALTGRADRAWVRPMSFQLAGIGRALHGLVNSGVRSGVTIEDALGDAVRLVPGSALPAASVGSGGRMLTWFRPVLPADGITLTYLVYPQAPGRHAANRYAEARYRDAEGVERTFVFPIPYIEVVTPTPTVTPEPTPTPQRERVYLPVARGED